MFDLSTFRLGPHVGTRVCELRTARGWTQRDLAAELNKVSVSWTRAKVGQLEASGVRGERLTDLAMICLALKVSLRELLSGQEPGSAEFPHEFLLNALAGPAHARSAATSSAVDPSRIGAEDEAAELRVAERLGTSVELTRALAEKLFLGASLSQARDALAQIDETTSPREAQAKRGHATRRVHKAMEAGEADAAMLYLIGTWLKERTELGGDASG